jgi:Flp pilus assembly protein TadD
VLFKLREGKQGYVEFQEAYKRNKKLPTPPVAVVMYYRGDNQPELAEKWMAFAEKEYGTDSATRLFLGTSQWQKGNFAEAKRHAQAAAAADANSAAVQFLVGVLAHYEGDLKTAEDKLEAAFKAAPADLQIRDQLAKVLIQNSNPEKRNRALAIAQQSAQIGQNNRDLLATLGWILYNSGQTNNALQVLQVVTQGPIGGDSAYFVSRVLVDKKQEEDARKLLTDSLENKSLFVHRRDAEKLLKQLKS